MECVRDDNKTLEQSAEEKFPIGVVIPPLVSLCFLLSLGAIIYQRRLIQNINRQASRKVQTSTMKENTLIDNTEPVYEMPTEVSEYNERNETGDRPEIFAPLESGDIIEIYTVQEPSIFETGDSLEICTIQKLSAFETGDRQEICTIPQPLAFDTTDKSEISRPQKPSVYVSLNGIKDPVSIYQSLQLSGVSTHAQHSNSGRDQASILMSLKDNREPGNTSPPLQSPTTSTHPNHVEEGDQLQQTLMRYENPVFDPNFGGYN